jgi:hypothetical protein
MWFFSTHFATNLKSVIKGRLGIKAFLTSKKRGTLNKTFKGIASFITKRTILLGNLFSPVLKKGLMETKPSKNIKKDICNLLNTNKDIFTQKEIIEKLPILFRITHYFLKEMGYSLLKSPTLIGKNSWLMYAPCSINEGPIFTKRSNKRRVEILKQIPSLKENKIRPFLTTNFKMKEILK